MHSHNLSNVPIFQRPITMSSSTITNERNLGPFSTKPINIEENEIKWDSTTSFSFKYTGYDLQSLILTVTLYKERATSSNNKNKIEPLGSWFMLVHKFPVDVVKQNWYALQPPPIFPTSQLQSEL